LAAVPMTTTCGSEPRMWTSSSRTLGGIFDDEDLDLRAVVMGAHISLRTTSSRLLWSKLLFTM
jgi:hypothetical protein